MEQPRRLTKRQQRVVELLMAGCTPAEAAARRGHSLSATYEIVARICDRWQVSHWTEIVAKARAGRAVEPSPEAREKG